MAQITLNSSGVASNGVLKLQSNGTTDAMTIGTDQAATFVNIVALPLGSVSAPSVTFTGDTNTGIYSSGADAVDITTGGTQRGQFDSSGNFKFNSGYGSVATAYGCRAWVNFNGTGTVAIRASGNVSSITDNGTGNYTVNFTTAMPDANYAVVMTAGDTSSGTCLFQSPFNISPTISAAQVLVTNSVFTATDRPFVQVAIFR